jgi:hypothetical protein
MGAIEVLKKNKVGAVVVSVFDWYRESSFPVTIKLLTSRSRPLSNCREKAAQKT